MPTPPTPPSPLPEADEDARGYDDVPRRPEESLLYLAVAGGLETFLARARERGRCVPRFVEREFQSFLDCGILAHGFLRVRCDACGYERLVPFSCKGRGFCPSCGGRRMADTAAHLVDRVFPVVPVRQWILTLPWRLRYRMAFDPGLTGDVLREFVRAVFGSLRRRARRRGFACLSRCAAVTFVQRFGDALNLNVHFHSLVLDGVYETDGEGRLRFRALPPPDDTEVGRVAARIARRLPRVLEKRGLHEGADPAEVDPLVLDDPLLAALSGASVRGRIATGRRAGQPVLRLGDRVDAEDLESGVPAPPRCATVAGVSVHANVSVPARDRKRLERLCRYVARPPLATERLSLLPDGRLLYRLKRRWRDGTTHVVFEPLELIEKLAALVPPPRLNLVRYHGILAPAARDRGGIVPPGSNGPASASACGCLSARSGARPSRRQPGVCSPGSADRDLRPSDGTSIEPRTNDVDTRDGLSAEPRIAPRPRRYTWAELMRRVFAVDLLECPRCRGPMRILAAIQPPEATQAILECLGLPARPPPVAPAEPEPIEHVLALDDFGSEPEPEARFPAGTDDF